jgi:glycine/D-amino acid oxidase-like deaminating enzyme
MLRTFEQFDAKYERLEHGELRRRFPQLEIGPISWGILEPDAGVLMARRAVQAVVSQARAEGVDYLQETISPPPKIQNEMPSIQTTSGTQIVAERYVFACGPWLPKLFPDLLGELIHVTRQEVFFVGVPPGEDRFNLGTMPVWIDFNDLVYAIPNLDNRGFKIAIDAHGPEFDPDTGDRVVSESGLKAMRKFLTQRVPLLANAPVTETRVCQYENTSNGDFLIDRHPKSENVWLVGGGSGHGFKHGPAVGEYVVQMLSGEGRAEPRFGLTSKAKVRERAVY